MPNLNQVFLIGNLTRDPESRFTPSGTAVAQFSLAINRSFKAANGEKQEEVVFVDVEAWGKSAEVITKYCAKGRPLFVSGRLKLDQWEDKKTGEKKSRMKVVCENFQLLGGKPEGASQGAQSEPDGKTTLVPPARRAEENLDEDTPF